MPKQEGIYLEFKAAAVIAMLNALAGVNMEVLHADLGEEMIAIIQERHDAGLDVFGIPFKPIKEYTYSFGTIKRIRKPDDTPLKAGLGAPPLSRSYEHEETAEEVLVGTPVFHAKFHSDWPDNNQGPRDVIPLREVMGVELDKDYARLVGVVEDEFYTLAEVKGNLV